MNNKEIYRKTIGFSVRRLVWDILAFILLGALTLGGFYIADKTAGNGTPGLLIGLLAGLIAVGIFLRYISYTYKAGQIAMITRAVTEGSLPDDVVAEGKRTVKERFATVAAYFAVTRVIRGIFQQIGRGITSVGESIGGDKGGTVGSVISAAIQTVVAYLCDCCLGWVFYRRETKATRATCEGAVLFFKHGKTLAKNMGRVFGIGLISLVLIGGAFAGIFYGIFSAYPVAFGDMSAEFAELLKDSTSAAAEYLTDPGRLMITAAVLAGVILWSILHSAFVRPFILTGVLRNYIQSGMEETPTEASFRMLDSKSARFAKLHAQLD